jgi:hypothetical protein
MFQKALFTGAVVGVGVRGGVLELELELVELEF